MVEASSEGAPGHLDFFKIPIYPGHPLAQRSHILALVSPKDLNEQGFLGTFRPHVGSTLDASKKKQAFSPNK